MDDNSRGFEWNADGIKWKGKQIEMVEKSIPHFVTLPSSNSVFHKMFCKNYFHKSLRTISKNLNDKKRIESSNIREYLKC